MQKTEKVKTRRQKGHAEGVIERWRKRGGGETGRERERDTASVSCITQHDATLCPKGIVGY